ncbi:MAG TPA: SRPBCC family protein [Kineosporiaceae bacterium]
MPKVSRSLAAAVDPATVWELAVSLPRVPEWNTMHEGFTGEVPDALTEGSTYRQRAKLMGMPAEISWRVTAAEAPGRLELAGDGPMGVKTFQRWSITPSGDGTQVTLEMEFTGPSLVGPMAMMVEKQAGTATQTSLARFGQLLA